MSCGMCSFYPSASSTTNVSTTNVLADSSILNKIVLNSSVVTKLRQRVLRRLLSCSRQRSTHVLRTGYDRHDSYFPWKGANMPWTGINYIRYDLKHFVWTIKRRRVHHQTKTVGALPPALPSSLCWLGVPISQPRMNEYIRRRNQNNQQTVQPTTAVRLHGYVERTRTHSHAQSL